MKLNILFISLSLLTVSQNILPMEEVNPSSPRWYQQLACVLQKQITHTKTTIGLIPSKIEDRYNNPSSFRITKCCAYLALGFFNTCSRSYSLIAKLLSLKKQAPNLTLINENASGLSEAEFRQSKTGRIRKKTSNPHQSVHTTQAQIGTDNFSKLMQPVSEVCPPEVSKQKTEVNLGSTMHVRTREYPPIPPIWNAETGTVDF